jgi:hypothetical protein
MAGGKALVESLKKYIVGRMNNEPECAPGAPGLGNAELEQICELELHLDAQDHYLMYSLLHSLIRDGRVEKVQWPNQPRRPKYRLRD